MDKRHASSIVCECALYVMFKIIMDNVLNCRWSQAGVLRATRIFLYFDRTSSVIQLSLDLVSYEFVVIEVVYWKWEKPSINLLY
jgi:hypothetical protein